MDLQTVWFLLIAVLFIGFFFLEGFDYGVGILLPFLGKDDKERRAIINTIGPFWDGNEVWMITAGGAMFAAFPDMYATMFSGFYIALVLLLAALIVRGVAFEFRSKAENPAWRNFWDWMIFVGSLLPALLWGVAMSDLILGVPINEDMMFVGSLFDLLQPVALLGGVAAIVTFAFYGATYLSLKTAPPLEDRALKMASRLWVMAMIVDIIYAPMTYFTSDMYERLGINPGAVPLLGLVALILAGWFVKQRREGWAFAMTAASIVATVITLFMGLYPRLMVSSLNPDWSVTIYNASSSPYTLKVMTIVALLLVPFVLVYQGWTYYIFRQRIRLDAELEY